MADFHSIKLNPDSHLLSEQPLLRVPYELSRNNFKSAQRQIEQSQAKVDELLKTGLKNANPLDPTQTLASLDQAVARLQTLKRKLESLNEGQTSLVQQSEARITHLDQLYQIPTLADVKYERWSRTRLDRLLVDYMLRNGYTESAKELASEKNIEPLTDIEEFESARRIERSLRLEFRVDLALAWCGENKLNLKKLNSDFEHDLRLQQYIELVRAGNPDKLIEAISHAKKFLHAAGADYACGLLAMCHSWKDPSSSILLQPYRDMLSPERWYDLANKFIRTHHKLFSLPTRPSLHISLTAGLSALKTPACHSKYISSTLNQTRSPPSMTSDYEDEPHVSPLNTILNTPVCPICSTELNKIARPLPYAHHSKSHVENDPVMLPNGRVYGRQRLIDLNDKLQIPHPFVVDPAKPDIKYGWNAVRKVFIT